MLDTFNQSDQRSKVELPMFQLPKISKLDKKYVFSLSGATDSQVSQVMYDNRSSITKNGRKKNRLHTIIDIQKLERVIGHQRVNERVLDWHREKVLNGQSIQSMTLYLSIDDFVMQQYQHSPWYLGVDDYEILVLSKELGIKQVGVFIRAPGYNVATMPLIKLFDWINKGIKRETPKLYSIGVLTRPLVTMA